MKGSKITVNYGTLNVPNDPIIPFIEGDGSGPDIWAASKRVFDSAVRKAYGDKKEINWLEVLAGEKAYKQTGNWLNQETLYKIMDHIVAIKGPLTAPYGGVYRSLNVALRQLLDLYVCLRPVRYFEGAPSPVKHPEQTNMAIFRENSEDIYAGIEWMQGTDEALKVKDFLINEMGVTNIRFPETASIGVKPISMEGSKRIVRDAIKYALQKALPSVCLVHKGNIMKFTEGAFKNWGYEVAEHEFGSHTFTMRQYNEIKSVQGEAAAIATLEESISKGKLIVKDYYSDAFLQQILINPSEYSVICTMNLIGDFISDALFAIVGGTGIAPGANINFTNGYAVFEATHGTMPELAGMNKANPGSLILSGVMMLEYIGWDEAANLIVEAVGTTIKTKYVTHDFAQITEGATELSCSEYADKIIENM